MKENIPSTQAEQKPVEYPMMPPTFAKNIDNYDIRLAYRKQHCDRVKAAEKKAETAADHHAKYLNGLIAGFWNDASTDDEQNKIIYNHYNKQWKIYASMCRVTSKKVKVNLYAFEYYVTKALKVRRILELDSTLTFEIVDKWNDSAIDLWLITHDKSNAV